MARQPTALERKAYSWEHRRIRKKLLPKAYGTPCPRCRLIMFAWQELDLGHSEAWRKKAGLPGDRIEHMLCNRTAGEQHPEYDGPIETARPLDVVPPPSKDW